MVQINDDFFEDLTPETTIKILDALRNGQPVKPGPQSGRHSSEPAEGRTALTSEVSWREGSEVGDMEKGSREREKADAVSLDAQPYGPGQHCVPEFA